MYSKIAIELRHSRQNEKADVQRQQRARFGKRLDLSQWSSFHQQLNDILQRPLLRRMARTPFFLGQA